MKMPISPSLPGTSGLFKLSNTQLSDPMCTNYLHNIQQHLMEDSEEIGNPTSHDIINIESKIEDQNCTIIIDIGSKISIISEEFLKQINETRENETPHSTYK